MLYWFHNWEPSDVKNSNYGNSSLIANTLRVNMECNGATSPTAMTELILITATIDAKQNCDETTADILNDFVQMDVDVKNQVRGE
jgi:hypothetical protein